MDKAELLLVDSEIDDKLVQLQDKRLRKNRAVKRLSSEDSDDEEMLQSTTKKSASLQIPKSSFMPKLSLISKYKNMKFYFYIIIWNCFSLRRHQLIVLKNI